MDENPRIADLRKKLEKDPGSRLFAQLAEELRKEGRHEEAISVAQDGLEKNPNYPSARLTLARALVDAGRPKEARPELEQIVKASPDNILAGRLLGEVLEALGEEPEAIREFERTLRLVPDDKGLYEKVADLKRRTGEIARKAAEFLGEAPLAAAPAPLDFPTVSQASAPPPPSVFDAPTHGAIHPPAPAGPPSLRTPSAPPVGGFAVPLAPHAPAARPAASGLPRPATPPAAPAPRPAPAVAAPVVARPPAPPPASATARSAAVSPQVPGRVAPPPPAVPPAGPVAVAPRAVAPPPAPMTLPVPPGPAASVAFDRDLASGTFSPGSLNVAELQKHFESVAAAERLAPPPGPAASAALPQAPAIPTALPNIDTAETVSLGPLPETALAPFHEEAEFPSVEMPQDDQDIGAQTLPLTSMTLADLYLQQGLKKEASAVLSQVLREEPDNARAKSKFAEVSEGKAAPATVVPVPVAPVPVVPMPAASLPPRPPAPAVAVAPARPRPTKAEIRNRIIHDLRAFEGAAEREALHQRATEQGVF